MNPPDMYFSHMSNGPPAPQQTVTSNAMPSHYGHQAPQPTLMQPTTQYGAATAYPHSYYGIQSPQSAAPVNGMGHAQNVLPLPNQAQMHSPHNNMPPGFDTTGQVAPPGMKPRVTATLWEDEGSLCFQVEARGICVARREDNHMINGTKLLNVAGMTRGRRDGILKSEKVRHVVKIGPMHLKGVWIPFERALDFANKEKITEMLYPLFVHNIGSLLYHPTNQSRTNQVMAAAERHKREQSSMRGPPGSAQQTPGALPSIGQHHHHMSLPGPQPPVPSHANGHRPSLDRAHTFPTPPTSASSVMGNMGAQENFQWNQSHMNGPAQPTNPISIDTNLSTNPRSMPATPATTPPGTANTLQNMQAYSQSGQYDASRGVYSNSGAQQSPYAASQTSPQERSMYGQTNAYMKNDMGPPSSRAPDQNDAKPPTGILSHGEAAAQHAGDDEAEHEAEYTHDSGAYNANRGAYEYNGPQIPPLANDHSLPSDMAGSPNHQAGSGRATPRTAAPPQPYYPGQTAGYNTPPRVAPSSSLYSVMTNDRNPTNGASSGDVYGSQGSMGLQNGYGAQVLNGAPSLKRGRDDEDDITRSSGGHIEMKRRKTLVDGVMPGPGFDVMNRPAPAIGPHR